MTRIIIILLAVFIILTIIRNFIRRFKFTSGTFNKPEQKQKIKKDKKDKDDDNIIDAKFEEIK